MNPLGNFLGDSKGNVRSLGSRLWLANFQHAGFVPEDCANRLNGRAPSPRQLRGSEVAHDNLGLDFRC